MSELLKVTSFQKDMLKEVSNIGAGSAATALAKLLKCKVVMTVPGVNVMALSEIAEAVGGSDNKVVGIYERVEGAAPGSILFVLSIDSALLLLDIMLNKPYGSSRELDDFGLSVVQEMGNIVTGSFMNSLYSFTNIRYYPSVPAVAVDMVGAMLNTVLYQYGFEGDHALIIETEFTAQDHKISGKFFYFPDPGPLAKLFSNSGLNNG